MFILAISLHQDVMRRAQTEIDTVVGRERMPTFEDYDRLSYVSAVVKEVIRCNSISLLGMSCPTVTLGDRADAAQVCRISAQRYVPIVT